LYLIVRLTHKERKFSVENACFFSSRMAEKHGTKRTCIDTPTQVRWPQGFQCSACGSQTSVLFRQEDFTLRVLR